MKDKTKVTYERAPDGTIRKLEETTTDKADPDEIVNEYAGLLGQRARLLEKLEQNKSRIEGLQPIVDEILADVESRSVEAASSDDGKKLKAVQEAASGLRSSLKKMKGGP